jgi:hypothetical protein
MSALKAKHQKRKYQKRAKRNRKRAMPATNAFRYSINDAQAMGAPSRTKIYEMLKDGRLTRAPDVPGMPTGITGESLRALLGINEEAVA